MDILTLLYVFCLFYIFIPRNIIKLPFKMDKMGTTVVHALLFSLILTFTYDLVESVNLFRI